MNLFSVRKLSCRTRNAERSHVVKSILQSVCLGSLVVMMGAGGAEAAPSKPQLPPMPAPQTNYSGVYDLSYLALNGSVEVCIAIGPQRTCEPLLIDVPLYNGQVTTESLYFIVDVLNAELASLVPNLPAELYPSYDLVETYVFPLVVEELNMAVAALPTVMELRAPNNSSLYTASMTVKSMPMVLPGQFTLSTGNFALATDVMVGKVDATLGFKGLALMEVPVRINESIGYQTPSGTSSTLEFSLRGVLGADELMLRR